jgi:hypothetical protein
MAEHISGPIQRVLTDLWQKRKPSGKRMFNPNSKSFKRDYDRLYKIDPAMANMFLLICELADENGQVIIDEQQLAELMQARFNDPGEYALKGGKDA